MGRPRTKERVCRGRGSAADVLLIHIKPLHLETKPNARVPVEALDVGDAAEDERDAAVVGVELVGALGARGKGVLERVGARGGDIGGDDRATDERDFDPNGIS